MTQLNEALRSSSSSSSGGDGPSEPEVSAGSGKALSQAARQRVLLCPPSHGDRLNRLASIASYATAPLLQGLAPAPPGPPAAPPPFPLSLQALQQLHEDLESLAAEQPAGVRPSFDGLDLPSLGSAKGTGPRLFCGHVPKASGFRRARDFGAAEGRATKRCSRYWIRAACAFAATFQRPIYFWPLIFIGGE